MNEPTLSFDDLSDTLTVIFATDDNATPVQLNEYVTIFVDVDGERICGMILADYSLLISETKRGLRYFPLVLLNTQPTPLRNLVLDLLSAEPASQVVSLGVYTPSLVDTMPVISVKAVFPLELPLWQTHTTTVQQERD